MAGTVTATKTFASRTQSRMKAVEISWLSDASGDATLTTSFEVNGYLLGAKFIPGSGGAAPDANYDVTISDADGLDLLNGKGANRSASAAEYVPTTVTLASTDTISPIPVAPTTLAIAVSGAGNANSGRIVLIFEER